MTNPHIYIGSIPTTAAERRTLREHAAALIGALSSAPSPIGVLLHITSNVSQPIELLLLSSQAALVGIIRHYTNPIEVSPSGHWTFKHNGATLHEARGQTPFQLIAAQRNTIHEYLAAEIDHLDPERRILPIDAIIGALICAPALPAESRISLDIDEHRQLLKILGLDELAGLLTMSRHPTRLNEADITNLITNGFGGQLWHDGARFLFELAPSRYRLRKLSETGPTQTIYILNEGETIIGRRRTSQAYELRVTLADDDLISSDHARLLYGDSPNILLRDTSKNGTWITLPGQNERRLSRADAQIVPGSILRFGETRLILEAHQPD